MAKVNADSQSGEGTVWFDYFNVVTNTTNASSTSFTASTSTTSASSTTNSGSATPTPTTTGKKSNLGGILGGVIGGVILFLVLLLCLWRYRRRKNNSGKIAQFKPDIDPDPSSRMSPFFFSIRVSAIYISASQQQARTTFHHSTPTQRTSIHFLWATEPSAQSTIQADSLRAAGHLPCSKNLRFTTPRTQ